MTKEEAKLVLDNARPQTKEIDRQFYDDEDLNNALDMAIKSLEQQSSDDCVSRTQAIEWIENLRQMDECFGNYEDDYFPLSEVIDRLKNVPPVTPVRGTCKDCKHCRMDFSFTDKPKCLTHGLITVNDDFYCKDFEKRGGESE